jgi:hypothetical protein
MRSPLLRSGLALSAAVLAIGQLAAQAPKSSPPKSAPAEALPTARAVIDRHITAIGGKEAVLAQTSTHAIATLTIPGPGVTGKVEIFNAKPNKFVQRTSLPGIGDDEQGFDGVVGWSISPLTGPTVLDGKQLEERRFDAEFFEELKADGRYRSMTTAEKTTFEGRPVYRLRLVKPNGDEDVEFYDVETGLKAGAVASRDSPMGPIQGTTITTDYKQFGPLLYPATTKIRMMSTEMIMSILSVEYGKVDPAIFAPPAQIKALIK